MAGLTRKRRRLYAVATGLLLLGGAAALVLTAFQDNLVFFFTPSQAAERSLPPGQRIRLGGIVEPDSVKRDSGTTIRFRVTDMQQSVAVAFNGILPDLFREGQGVVANGAFRPDGSFAADEVLAKHDENYMPPEVADALKKSGRWQEGSAR